MTRKSKRLKRSPTDLVPLPGVIGEHAVEGGDGCLSSPLRRLWAESRYGAIAGRGYRYQDLVGAWLALRVLTGDIGVARVVAEGFDDLTGEGSAPLQLQAKSRQERVGDFGTGEVARFVIEAWRRRSLRIAAEHDEACVIVVERPVDGYAPLEWARQLNADDGWARLLATIRQLAAATGMSADAVDLLVARTTVIVLPQQIIFGDAAKLVAARTGLPLGATLPVIQALRAAVGEDADTNAEVSWGARAGLSRTDIERIVTTTAALVDRELLEAAVGNGSCEPVDFDTPLTAPDFYTGTSTQPGHIAAGLVTPRPAAADQVLAGLGGGRAVLIAGPSGMGKSALLWMAAYVARHVVWYRVHRLGVGDVEPLMRLAIAAGAGRFGPVGFIVDGVGTGSLSEWDALHRRAAATPGVLLLGSVREEDTLPLRTFGECAVVRPRLDEDLAARIHRGLLESGATAQPHWREAYERSEGLTLEFTHLLSRGRRLTDVIRDQVRERIHDHRTVELAVIAPVSVADRWGAPLSFRGLAEIVAVSPGELKKALTRLADEHLITVDDGGVHGVHPLRSAALCEAVHETPPPIGDTVSEVVKRIGTDYLASFVARAIAGAPGLAPVIVESLSARLVGEPGDLTLLAGALAGLRLADFTLTARRWAEIFDQHDVPSPYRPLGLNFVMSGSELPEGLDPRLAEAIEEIRRDSAPGSSPLRDLLLRNIATVSLGDLADKATIPSEVTALLSPLDGTGVIVAPLPPGAPLRAALRNAPLRDIGELIATARNVSTASAEAFLDAAGGGDAMIERLMHDHPFLVDLGIVNHGDDLILRGRVLRVADRYSPDPEKEIRDLAALGLRCLPLVDRADLVTVVAGGQPLRVNDLEFAVSGVLRRYCPSDSEVAWNRARSRFARSLVTEKSMTERLAAGLTVLDSCALFLADLADAWVTNRLVGERLDALDRKRSSLLKDIDALTPAFASEPLPEPVNQPSEMRINDPIHGVAQGIVGNLASRLGDPSGYVWVAAFADDTIMKQLDDARDEPWTLIGLDEPPPVLDRLAGLLRQLATVLVERAVGDTTPSQIASVARSMPRGKGLARAADLARARAQRRYEERLTALVAEAAATGIKLKAASRPIPDAKIVTWPPVATAVLADLDATNPGTVIETLAALMRRFPLPDHSLVVIPVHGGVPLLRHTLRLFSAGEFYPMPHEAQQWLDLIPPTHPMLCSEAVAHAVEALSERSSLAWLGTRRSTGRAVQEAVDEAWSRFAEATADLDRMPRDATIARLTDEIERLADQVQHEADDHRAAGSFAKAMACALSGNANDILLNVSGLLDVATQWDIDRATAGTIRADQ